MAKSAKIWLFILTGFMALTLTGSALAANLPDTEQILSYDSQITVFQDGSMQVTETITVAALNDQINHGIYRDFPTEYKDQSGNKFKVGFEILSVSRDGEPEGYFTENQSNGVRVYIGQKDVILDQGIYTYQITYLTTRQLGFFPDHDELYWNVTGNGWVFPILKASATVTLPGVAGKDLKLEAFTGASGATAKNFESKITGDQPTFSTTQTLDSYEGLTIVVGWPKGFVHEPTPEEKIRYLLADNLGIIIGLLGFIIILLYYFWIWLHLGRDPQKNAIIPQYEPPTGFSPALCGYIMKMGYSSKFFSAAIISMAVKGYLKISQDKKYTLTKTGTATALSDDEKVVAKEILDLRQEIKVDNANHSDFSAAINAFKKSLAAAAQKKYFNTQRKYFLAGAVLSAGLLFAALSVNGIEGLAGSGFAAVWLIFWTFGVYALLVQVASAWQSYFGDKKITSCLGALFLTIFCTPFLFGEIIGLFFFTMFSSVFFLALLLTLMAINIIFYALLKAPTVEGRKIMDEIEGFKWFLTVTEKDRMNFHNPPDKTPALFEKFLPFALALGVENQWAEQFAAVFKNLADQGKEYQPTWYSGTNFSALAVGNFAGSLSSSFNHAVSAASAAPGSSSGFGGGGSSGGGGGGGGGGGW